MTSIIITEFLQSIVEDCFDRSHQEKQSIEKTLLQHRFNPVNFLKEHSDVIKQPPLNNSNLKASINTYIGNIVDAIVKTYEQEMRNNNINTEILISRSKGRPKEDESPWRKVYDWLWNYKFPAWAKQKYTEENWFLEALFKNANSNQDWIEFVPEYPKDGTRIAKGGERREGKTIDVNQHYLMSLKLPHPEHHLLLLNRAEDIISFMCPSQDFAPMSQLLQEEIKIPQETAEYKNLVFKTLGKEEFLAIVVNNLPPKDSLNTETIYQFWRNSLEEQKNWQVFYEAFAVV